MDAVGAQQLRVRLAHQEHWDRADAVRRGEQSRVDPDALELEEIRDGLRLYSIREESRRIVEGSAEIVTTRMTKRLVDGWWETRYEVERVRPLVPA
jgi:hypothetical protein